MSLNGVKIGVGVIMQRSNGDILVGKRKNSIAPYYSIPGGKLEVGETFEECAIREVAEETGVSIKNPEVVCVTNNIKTYKEEGIHFVSIGLYQKVGNVIPLLKEPDKCEEWLWVNPNDLPQPHFEASSKCVNAFLTDKLYHKD